MSVQCGTLPPRLLPLLVALLLVCLCLQSHTAEAKKRLKKPKQPTAKPISATAPATVAVDVDAQPPPLSFQTDALLADPTADADASERRQQRPTMRWTTGAANTAASASGSKPAINASSSHPHTDSTTPSPASSSDRTAASTPASPLLYPLLALGATASAVCLAYAYYRLVRTTHSPSTAAPLGPPLLRLLPAGHAAGRAQGCDWAVQQLRWDGDGDAAHEFLGPFLFSSGSNGTRQDSNQPVTHEQTAG